MATIAIATATSFGLTQPAQQSVTVPLTEPVIEPVTEPTRERAVERPGRSLQREVPSPSATPRQGGTCGASFYWEPQPTANGETFDPEALTAAHKTLAFNSRVRVTNSDNGKSVTVRINDRGPYIDGRCLDLSRAAFREIASLDTGVLDAVHYEVIR